MTPRLVSYSRIVDISCEATVTADSSASKTRPRNFLLTLVPRRTGKTMTYGDEAEYRYIDIAAASGNSTQFFFFEYESCCHHATGTDLHGKAGTEKNAQDGRLKESGCLRRW